MMKLTALLKAAALALILLLIWAAPVRAGIVRLTDNSHNEFTPRINNAGQVAWQSWQRTDRAIHLWDGSTGRERIHRFTDAPYGQFGLPESLSIQLSDGGQVVWAGWDGTDHEIYVWDGVTARQITHNGTDDLYPRINATGKVVWQGYDGAAWSVHLWNGSSAQQLATSAQPGLLPQINDGGQVVWRGFDGGDWEIFLWNGSAVQQITQNTVNDIMPRINNRGQVLWHGAEGYHFGVYLWEPPAVRRLSSGEDSSNGQINNGGQAAWEGWQEIYLWDGYTVRRLTENTVWDRDLALNDVGQMVWVSSDVRGSPIINLWNGSALEQFPHVGVGPVDDLQINNSGQFVWRGSTGTSNEIYLYTPGDNGTLWLNPAVVTGGTSATGTITLSGPAPEGGIVASLASSDTGVATVPSSVTVAAGETAATFPIATRAVTGVTSVGISASFYGPTQRAWLKVVPSLQASIRFDPDRVRGGLTTTGIVTLSEPAPAGGVVVALSSDNMSVAPVPASVTVAEGELTARFSVTTQVVDYLTGVRITAAYGGLSQTASLGVLPHLLAGITIDPDQVTSGDTAVGRVTLREPAPAGGAVVALSSDNPAATVPPSVTVAAGERAAAFTLTTASVAASTSVRITASHEGGSVHQWLRVFPFTVRAVRLDPGSVTGGASVTGTVELVQPAPSGGRTVRLSSADTRFATVPASVTVAEGQTIATFPVTTKAVWTAMSIVISAFEGYPEAAERATLRLLPPVLATLTLDSATVGGRFTARGWVTLNGPAPPAGATVTLGLKAPVTGPASVWVPAGMTRASFSLTTGEVTEPTSVVISAAYEGVTQEATLRILPHGLASVTFSPRPVAGGSPALGTVTLSSPAPAGGATVLLSSQSPAIAAVPASVTVAPGETQATFTVTTDAAALAAQLGTTAFGISIPISATYGGVTQAGELWVVRPFTLGFDAAKVGGGTSLTSKIWLRAPAPAGGLVVTLTSENPAIVTVPASVTVPAGAMMATFPVSTSQVATTVQVAVSASAGGVTHAASLIVLHDPFASLVIAPDTLQGGSHAVGTVTLNEPAPAGGALIRLASDHGAIVNNFDLKVTVPAGAISVTFPVLARLVPEVTRVQISASYGEVTRSTTLTVLPPALSALAVSPTTLPGGATATGTVTLSGPAPREPGSTVQIGLYGLLFGAGVNLTSSDPAVATVPARVTVPEGTTTATFAVTTRQVARPTRVVISAEKNGVTHTFTLVVARDPLASFTLSPATVAAGLPVTGTIALSDPAPAGGAVVTLVNSNPAVAAVPASITVAQGETTASFPVVTFPVADSTSAELTASVGGSSRTAALIVMPLLDAIAVEPGSVTGGGAVTATVTLREAAPAGGAVIALSSTHPAAAAVPERVTVPAGERAVSFTVTTQPVPTAYAAGITASAGATRTATLQVLPSAFVSVAVSPSSVTGGASATGTVTLNGPAPPGGARVSLGNGNPGVVTLPASVIVPAGTNTATFPATTRRVVSILSVRISASYAGVTGETVLRVLPPNLVAMTLDASSVPGGGSVTGRVTLSEPVPASAVITLSSANPAVQVPDSVTVPAGAATATFPVTIDPVAGATSAVISAAFGDDRKSAQLTVVPVTLASLRLTPASVTAGEGATGTVTLSAPAPAGGVAIALSSSNDAAGSVPASVTVAPGQTTALFAVATHRVAGVAWITVSASYSGVKQEALLQVLPRVIDSLTLSPGTLTGGASAKGTITLAEPAPKSGLVITLSSSHRTARVPARIRIGARKTRATFKVSTARVTEATQVVIAASSGGGTREATLTALPKPGKKVSPPRTPAAKPAPVNPQPAPAPAKPQPTRRGRIGF